MQPSERVRVTHLTGWGAGAKKNLRGPTDNTVCCKAMHVPYLLSNAMAMEYGSSLVYPMVREIDL